MEKRGLIVAAALVISAIALAVLVWIAMPPLAEKNRELAIWFAYATSAALLIGALLILNLLHRHRIKPELALGLILFLSFTLIATFAGIYASFGLMSGNEWKSVDWRTAVYFSVVTWTTLGYGDYAPAYDIDLIAALEALFGLLFFGLLVGLLVNTVHRKMTGAQGVRAPKQIIPIWSGWSEADEAHDRKHDADNQRQHGD